MTNHTSGPWTLFAADICSEWNDGLHPIAHVRKALPWHEDYRKSLEEAEANGRLLAAAPQMADVIEVAASQLEGKVDPLQVAQQLRSVLRIARAEGRP